MASSLPKQAAIPAFATRACFESALNAPFQSFGTVEPFPSIQQKAARLGYGLIKNHPFVDGNKRIGAHAMLVFVALNRIELEYTQEELSDVIIKVAAGECGFDALLKWIIMRQLG